MGSLCSKTRLVAVTQPTKLIKFKSPEGVSVNEPFVVEKADHNFVLSAFGTSEPNKWDIEKLSRELKYPVRPYETLLTTNNPEFTVRLPPVLNPDGTVYYGEWKNNQFDGTGHLFMENGSQYIGAFSEGNFEGSGEILFVNGDVFKGMFSGGKRHGKGVLQFKNGDVYDGAWSYGSRHGYGVERFADGTVFMGNFKNNKRSGHGELKKPDGIHYEGHFNNNQITGIGKMQWPNGETYTGGFRNGMKHGNGTTTWRTGEYITHKGYYKDGKMSGNFRIVKRDGSVQEAQYHNDQFVKNIDVEDRKFGYTRYSSSKSSQTFSRSSTKLSVSESLPNGSSIDKENMTTERESLEFKGDPRKSPNTSNEGFASKFNIDTSEKLNFERATSKESFDPGSRSKSSTESSPKNRSASSPHTTNDTSSKVANINTNGVYKQNSRESLGNERLRYNSRPPRDFNNRSPNHNSRLRYKRVGAVNHRNSRESTDYAASHSLDHADQKSGSLYGGSQGHSQHDLDANGHSDTAEANPPFRRNRYTPRGRYSRPYRGRRGSSRYTT